MLPKKFIKFLLIVLLPSFGFAQATLTGSPITADVSPTRFGSEVTATNTVVGTISASAIADDNNNNSKFDPVRGAQYYIVPSLAIQQSRTHLKFNLAYSPGLRIYVPSSSQPDRFSHTFGGTLHYDVSKRLSIDLRQDYVRADDPFQQLGQAPFQKDIGLLNRPGMILLPDVRYTSLLSQANVNYKLAKHTLFGVNGTFMQIHRDQQHGQISNLIDTHDVSGSAFLSHQFSAKQSIGIQYQWLNIVFPQSKSRTTAQGVFLFDQIALSPHLSLTVFAGPQFSRIHGQALLSTSLEVSQVPVSKTLWSPAGGATLKWERRQTAFDLAIVRRVANGNGLLGSVNMTDASLTVEQKFTRRWLGRLDGHWTDEKLLQVPGASQLRALYTGPEISREFGESTWLRFAYQRIQRSGGYLSTLGFGDHNRVMLTFERSFDFPIGR